MRLHEPGFTPELIAKLDEYGVASTSPGEGFCCIAINLLGRLPLKIEEADGDFDVAWQKLLEVAGEILSGRVSPAVHLSPRTAHRPDRKSVDISAIPVE